MWHFARGMAFAHFGDKRATETEQSAWQAVVAKQSPDVVINETNSIGAVLKVEGALLSAAIARSRRDEKETINFLRQAVAAEDALNYSEPPAFYPPVRPLLGRALLDVKQFPDAEQVFRADLERHPRNPRALSGLRDCLKAENRLYDAAQVDQQLRDAQSKIDKVSTTQDRK
jgi:hypothetical protein